jgi:hypothetical protein
MMTTWPDGPFLGIVERPYDQDDLIRIDWRALGIELVNFRSLWLTQTKLSVAAILGHSRYSMDPLPHVVAHSGALYLEDGHHRVIRESIEGFGTTNVRVLRTPVRSRPVVVSQARDT